MKKLALVLSFFITMSCTACKSTLNNSVDANSIVTELTMLTMNESSSITFAEETIDELISVPSNTNDKNMDCIIPESIILYEIDSEMPFFSDTNEHGMSIEEENFYYGINKIEVMLPSLIKAVEKEYVEPEKISQWKSCYIYDSISSTKLSEQANLYSFMVAFPLTNDIYEELLINCEYTDDISGCKFTLTENEIKVLLSKNEVDILTVFAKDSTIVKGTKFFSPYWIYYHDCNAYIKEGISATEIIDKYDYYITMMSDEAFNSLTIKIDAYAEMQAINE